MRRALIGCLVGLLLHATAWGQWPAPKPRDTRAWEQQHRDAIESGTAQREQWRQQEAERFQQFRDFERERRDERRFRQLRDAIEERDR